VDEPAVRLIGVEAAGEGRDRKHAATPTQGRVGCVMSYLLQDEDGKLSKHTQISATGLSCVGPSDSYLKDISRAEYYSVTDRQALEAFQRLAQLRGLSSPRDGLCDHSRALPHLEWYFIGSTAQDAAISDANCR